MKILKRRQRDLGAERSGPHRRAEYQRASVSKGKRKMEEGVKPKNRPVKTCNTTHSREFGRPHHNENRREETSSPRRGSYHQPRQSESVFDRLGNNAPRRPRFHPTESNASSLPVRHNLESSFQAENDARARPSEGSRVPVYSRLGSQAPIRPPNPENEQLEAIKQTIKEL